jgi:hypothetical protein
MKSFQLPRKCEIFDTATGSVQSSGPLGEKAALALEPYLASHPKAWLRLYEQRGNSPDSDLRPLSLLPSLRHLDIDAQPGYLNDLAPLEYVTANLRSLSLDTLAPGGDNKLDKPKVNTDVLRRFEHLGSLEICGRIADLGLIPHGSKIDELSLWRTKLRSLDGIQNASLLKSLTVKWAGPISLSPIVQCAGLRVLELWDSKNTTDARAMAELGKLRRIWFISCGKDFKLCSTAEIPSLRVAVVHSSAGAENIAALAACPRLKCIVISNSPNKLAYEDFRPLFGHQSIREIRADNVEAGVLERLSTTQGWKVSKYPNFPAEEYL